VFRAFGACRVCPFSEVAPPVPEILDPPLLYQHEVWGWWINHHHFLQFFIMFTVYQLGARVNSKNTTSWMVRSVTEVPNWFWSNGHVVHYSYPADRNIFNMAPYVEDMKKHFQKNNKIREYSAHSSKVHSVAWSADGRRLASGSFDKTVCLFSLDRDRLVSVKNPCKTCCTCTAVHQGSAWIACMMHDTECPSKISLLFSFEGEVDIYLSAIQGTAPGSRLH
jgi:hypothetical protein